MTAAGAPAPHAERTEPAVTLAVREPAPWPLPHIGAPGLLHARIARLARTAAADIRIPDGEWADALAVIVLALPEVTRAFEAGRTLQDVLARLALLHDRHRPVRWHEESETVVCSCGAGAYPCTDRRILDGERPCRRDADGGQCLAHDLPWPHGFIDAAAVSE